MKKGLVQLVRRRAEFSCEYCRLKEARSPLPLVIDHIVARQHDGKTVGENLALACAICNRHKGPNISGVDPISTLLTRLFNPRIDLWDEHFAQKGMSIMGLTPVGCATIAVLKMNGPKQLSIRQVTSNQNT